MSHLNLTTTTERCPYLAPQSDARILLLKSFNPPTTKRFAAINWSRQGKEVADPANIKQFNPTILIPT